MAGGEVANNHFFIFFLLEQKEYKTQEGSISCTRAKLPRSAGFVILRHYWGLESRMEVETLAPKLKTIH